MAVLVVVPLNKARGNVGLWIPPGGGLSGASGILSMGISAFTVPPLVGIGVRVRVGGLSPFFVCSFWFSFVFSFSLVEREVSRDLLVSTVTERFFRSLIVLHQSTISLRGPKRGDKKLLTDSKAQPSNLMSFVYSLPSCRLSPARNLYPSSHRTR